MAEKPSEVKKLLIERLVKIRKRAGFSAKELSLKIGHADQYISRIETGKQYPSFEDLYKIAKICDSSMEEFFYRNFESYKSDIKFIEYIRSMGKQDRDALLRVVMAMHDKQY